MTEPSPPAGQPPVPHRPMPHTPMPRLGHGGRWSAHIEGGMPKTEPYQPPARPRPTGWAKTGNVGASAKLWDDEEPVAVPARPYGEPTMVGLDLAKLALPAAAELYTVNPDAGPVHGNDGLTVLREAPRPGAAVPLTSSAAVGFAFAAMLGPEPSNDGPPYTHRHVPTDEDEPPAATYTVTTTNPPSRRGWRRIFRRRTA